MSKTSKLGKVLKGLSPPKISKQRFQILPRFYHDWRATIYIEFLIFWFGQIHDIWSGSWYPDPELPVLTLLTLKSRYLHNTSSFRSKQPLISGFHVFEYLTWKMVKSISTGAQYVTPDSKLYCKKVKMCWF
jgi:hypothetical protein